MRLLGYILMYIKQGHRQKETYVKMQTETAIYKPKNLGIRINQFCKHYEFFKLSEFRTMRKQIFFWIMSLVVLWQPWHEHIHTHMYAVTYAYKTFSFKFSSTIGILRVILGFVGLDAGTFTYWAILLGHTWAFNTFMYITFCKTWWLYSFQK